MSYTYSTQNAISSGNTFQHCINKTNFFQHKTWIIAFCLLQTTTPAIWTRDENVKHLCRKKWGAIQVHAKLVLLGLPKNERRREWRSQGRMSGKHILKKSLILNLTRIHQACLDGTSTQARTSAPSVTLHRKVASGWTSGAEENEIFYISLCKERTARSLPTSSTRSTSPNPGAERSQTWAFHPRTTFPVTSIWLRRVPKINRVPAPHVQPIKARMDSLVFPSYIHFPTRARVKNKR